MPRRAWKIQTNFNRGELSLLMRDRTDVDTYYAGVELGREIYTLPQGGATKRGGRKTLAQLPGLIRCDNFSFNTEQNYSLWWAEYKLYIFKDGVQQVNISGSGNDYLIHPYTAQQIREFDYLQSLDTVILFHKDVQTRLIARTGDTSWVVELAPYDDYPQNDFNDSLSPLPTPQIQTIGFYLPTAGDTYRLTLNDVQTEDIVYSNTALDNETSITAALIQLDITGEDGITVSHNATTYYDILFDGASANDWKTITGTGQFTNNPRFQIVSKVDKQYPGSSRAEDAWSNSRGWPRCGTFHGNRMFVAGSLQMETTIWGSRSQNLFNFRQGQGFDNESIQYTVATDQMNAIQRIFSNRLLQVFTQGQEFFCPDNTITPNSEFLPQTNVGSKAVRPVVIDGITCLVNETGKALVQFKYDDESKINQANTLSTTSEHLIRNPHNMCVLKGTSSKDAVYLYGNNEDGTVFVFNSLAAEGVAGFTFHSTAQDKKFNSKILWTTIVDYEVHHIVERDINGEVVTLAEKEISGYWLDSFAEETTEGYDITGLDHLENETVHAVADGAYMGTFEVHGGEITLPRLSTNRYAGLFYFPDIKTMPANDAGVMGPTANVNKRISRASIGIYKSNGVICNGRRIPDKTTSVNQFDVPIPFTGKKRLRQRGWSLEAQIHLTQDTPMPFTITSIAMEVAT